MLMDRWVWGRTCEQWQQRRVQWLTGKFLVRLYLERIQRVFGRLQGIRLISCNSTEGSDLGDDTSCADALSLDVYLFA